jgi:phytoene dehydrogenase-like protein
MSAISHRRRDPPDDDYDVIVIGGGLGGLCAAAPLAKLGRKVLLLERGDGLGGCAHSFQRKDYTFDPAVHFMGAVQDEGFVDVFLRSLGVRDLVHFIPFDHMYGVDFPDYRRALPLGVEAFIEVHKREFAAQADGVEGFLEACVRMTEESQSLPPRLDLKSLDAAAKQFPFLFKYRKATVKDVLDDYLEDERVKALCAAAWPYVGLPPSRLSFVTFCAALLYAMEGGPHYCQGSFQNLVEALATAIERNGGQIAVEAAVTGIDVVDGAVRGVETHDGRRFRAPAIVSNADAKTTMEGMVGAEHLPERYLKRLGRMTPSLSAFWVFAATSLDLTQFDVPHEIFVHRHWNHDDNFRDAAEGRLGGMWLSMPTIADPTIAPEGEHIVILTSHMPYDIGESWTQARMRYEELMTEEIERLLPGFRDSINHLESATPETFQRWTGAYRGAIYGWENVPNQTTPKRLARVTPIEGLFLSGHWTEPGTAAIRAMTSGLQTAQMMLGYEKGSDLMKAMAAG